MAKLGNIELVAQRDVAKGNEARINDLFIWDEQRKEFELLNDVTKHGNIKVTIAKVESFSTKAGISEKKGEKISCVRILQYSDFSKYLKVSEDIKTGDKLMVAMETL